MEKVGNMKLYTLEEVTDEIFGKKGTPEREEFERGLAKERKRAKRHRRRKKRN